MNQEIQEAKEDLHKDSCVTVEEVKTKEIKQHFDEKKSPEKHSEQLTYFFGHKILSKTKSVPLFTSK